MIHRFAVTAMAAACVFSLGGPAVARTDPSGTPSQLRQALDAAAPGWLTAYGVPSVSVAYIVDGQLAWTGTWGERAPGEPADDRTLYNIASMTKPITAEVVLRLASSGRLSLDEPMARYWLDPDIAGDPRRDTPTAAMALRHRIGFANWRRQTDGRLSFQWDPGTRTEYSGEGYDYVARYAENRTGEDFEALAQEQVFGPLGLADTGYTDRADFAARAARPMGPDGEWGQADLEAEWSAADNVHTTAADYARFMISVMNGEGVTPELAAQRLLVEENQASGLCASGRLPVDACPQGLGFGLGWAVSTYPGETIVHHGGSDWGERALAFWTPETRTGVVVFTNGAEGMKVIRDVVALLYPNSPYVAFIDMQAR